MAPIKGVFFVCLAEFTACTTGGGPYMDGYAVIQAQTTS